MSGPYAPTDLRPETVTTAPLAGWSVPEGTVALAAEQAKEPAELKPTLTDALQQDAAPPVWPDGSPRLRPLMRLPRDERADFLEKLDPLWEKVQTLPRKGESTGPKEAAEMYRTLSEVEKFLRPLAEDPAEYDVWLAGPGADDATFMGLFNAFFAWTQPGEAAGSSS